MAQHLDLGDHGLILRLTGLRSVWALSSGVTLRPDEITGVTVCTRREALDAIGWRVMGTYWPGRIAAGWYSVRGSEGLRQLWDVRRDTRLLCVDTTRDRPCRLVLERPDPDADADALRRITSG